MNINKKGGCKGISGNIKDVVLFSPNDWFNTYLKSLYTFNKEYRYIIKDKRILDHYIVEQVWKTFCCESVISIFSGFDEVKLSSRFLANEAKVSLNKANRAINFLAVLGVIEKVKESGGIRGDRFKPCDPDDSELKRRYHTLFEDEKIDLGLFSREYVIEKLGIEIADQVFRSK